MFIHVGEKKIVSDKKIIGIFNYKTINSSILNLQYKKKSGESQGDIKTIVIDNKNDVIFSKVSSFTIIRRTDISDKDCVWSRK